MKIKKSVSAPEIQRKIKRSYLTLATAAAVVIVMLCLCMRTTRWRPSMH